MHLKTLQMDTIIIIVVVIIVKFRAHLGNPLEAVTQASLSSYFALCELKAV